MLHQGQLRRALEHAAARGHGRGQHEVGVGRLLANPLVEKEPHPLLDTHPGFFSAQPLDCSGGQLVRALVLVPGVHLALDLHRLPQFAFLEGRCHVCHFTLHRDERGDHAFAAEEVHAEEVAPTRAGFQKQRIDGVLLHECLRPFHSPPSLGGGDRRHRRRHRLEGTNSGGWVAGGFICARQGTATQGRSAEGGARDAEKFTSVHVPVPLGWEECAPKHRRRPDNTQNAPVVAVDSNESMSR